MCITLLAPSTLLYPPGKHTPTYRPEVGFFCFVDVVIQGGEVVARFHFAALTSDHVGSAQALARLCRATGKEAEGQRCSPHPSVNPLEADPCLPLNGKWGEVLRRVFLLHSESKYMEKTLPTN